MIKWFFIVGAIFACFITSSHLANAQDTSKAEFQEYLVNAQSGEAEAQFVIGSMHYFGQGTPKNDAAALKWLRKAAQQGHAVAQSSLGFMYYTGEGVPINYILAYSWSLLSEWQGGESQQSFKLKLSENMTSEQVETAIEFSNICFTSDYFYCD